MRRRYTCRICGTEGHNVRTCPDGSARHVKRYSCGYCGESGHNAATCPVRDERRMSEDYDAEVTQ